jgi:hypothetical protein
MEHLSGYGQMEAPVVISQAERIRQMARAAGRCFIKGLGESRRLYRALLA